MSDQGKIEWTDAGWNLGGRKRRRGGSIVASRWRYCLGFLEY